MAALEPKFLGRRPGARCAAWARHALGHAVHLQAGLQLAPVRHLYAEPHLQVGPQPQDPLLSVAATVAGEFESRSLAVEFI